MWGGGWRRKTKRQMVDERHERGMDIDEADVVPRGEDRWRVTSQSGAGTYRVSKLADQCPQRSCRDWDKCLFRCCGGLCQHMYSCTCPDEVALCKHVHRVRSLSVRASMTRDLWRAAINRDEAKRHNQRVEGKARRARAALRDLERFLDNDPSVLAGVVNEVVRTLEGLSSKCHNHADDLDAEEDSDEDASTGDDDGASTDGPSESSEDDDND